MPDAATVSTEILRDGADRQRMPKAPSVGQSDRDSSVRLPLVTMQIEKTNLLQRPYRRTGNNAAFAKCLTSCHAEILGQVPCELDFG